MCPSVRPACNACGILCCSTGVITCIVKWWVLKRDIGWFYLITMMINLTDYEYESASFKFTTWPGMKNFTMIQKLWRLLGVGSQMSDRAMSLKNNNVLRWKFPERFIAITLNHQQNENSFVLKLDRWGNCIRYIKFDDYLSIIKTYGIHTGTCLESFI